MDDQNQLEIIHPNHSKNKARQQDELANATSNRTGATFGKSGMGASKRSLTTRHEEEPAHQSSSKKIKIIRKIGESPAFQAIDRSKMAVNDHVWGVPGGPEALTYSPKHEMLKS